MSGIFWKVCGITRAEDAAAAVAAGADAIGFVFWPRSPRAVSVADAAALADRLPGDVAKVGVFVNPDPETVVEVAAEAGLDFIQFSGDEPPQRCTMAPKPAWKALRVAPGGAMQEALRRAADYADCTLILDADLPGEFGGTGEPADWEVAARLAAERRVLLAGGLRVGNVAAAIDKVRPWGVDVSSGVESAPGVKDAAKLRAFSEALEPYR